MCSKKKKKQMNMVQATERKKSKENQTAAGTNRDEIRWFMACNGVGRVFNMNVEI